MSDLPSIQELIQDQLDALPDSVREAVDSQDWRRKVYDIGRKYALKIDQLGALEQSTYYTMIGLIPSGKYISELVNQVGIARDIASSLAKEIDDGVFEDIRSFIMEMDGINEETANQLETKPGEQPVSNGSVPSREDLLSEIEAIGEPSSAPAPVVTFSPIETQLSKATASRPVDLNPSPTPISPVVSTPAPTPAYVPPTPVAPVVPVPVVTAPIAVAPVLPVAPKPAPVEIPIISLTDGADDAGLEFTESPQGVDKEETPTDTQIEAASQEDAALDLDSAPSDLSAVAMPEIPVTPVTQAPVTPAPEPVAPTYVPPAPVTSFEIPTAPAALEIQTPAQPTTPPEPVNLSTPGIPQAIPTPDGKISPTALTNDPYKEQF